MLRTFVRLNDLKTRLTRFGRDESGQDAFEYLLVIGVIMTAVVVAVAALFPDDGTGLVGNVSTAVGNKITAILT